MKRRCLTILFSLCCFYAFPRQFLYSGDLCDGSSGFFMPYVTNTHTSGSIHNEGVYSYYNNGRTDDMNGLIRQYIINRTYGADGSGHVIAGNSYQYNFDNLIQF